MLFGNWNAFYLMQSFSYNKLVLISCKEWAEWMQGKWAFWCSQDGEKQLQDGGLITTLQVSILSGLWLSKFQPTISLPNFYKGREERGVHAAEWFIGVVMLGQHKNPINILLNVLLYMTAFKWYIVWQFSRWLYKHIFLLQPNIWWSLRRLIYGSGVCASVHSPDNRDVYKKKKICLDFVLRVSS